MLAANREVLSSNEDLLLLRSHFSHVHSVCLHRRQPTRFPCPWDSPVKNSGVGCHFLFQCMKVKSESEVAQSCQTLCDPMDCSLPGSSVQGIFKSLLQHHSSKASILQRSTFFMVQLSHLYMTTGETIVLTSMISHVTSIW